MKTKLEKKGRLFKMPTAFTILFFILIIMVVLSWIMYWTGSEYSYDESLILTKDYGGGYDQLSDGIKKWLSENKNVNSSGEFNQFLLELKNNLEININSKGTVEAAGIVDVFLSILNGFVVKSEVIIFILTLGGFILITMNTKALEALTQGLARKLRNKSIFLIPILVTFFSFCGATYGMAEESLGFYMITIPLMLTAGFDTFTGLMIVLFGAGVGVLSSVVNPFVITVGAEAGGFSPSEGILFRWIAWLLFTSLTIAFITIYAARVKNNPSKSVVFDTYEGDKIFFLGVSQEQIPLTKKRIATIILFLLTFIIVIAYMVGWDQLFGGSTMEDAGIWINQHSPYITSMVPGFGMGGMVVMATFFFISAFIIALINWQGERKFTDDMVDGAKELLGVNLIIATAAGVGVMLKETHLQDVFISGLRGAVSNLNVIPFLIVSYILFLPLAFLVPSTAGFATLVFPIWGPIAVSVGGGAATGSLSAFSFSAGLLNLFTPTSGIVMGALAISRVSYGKLFKGAWPYFLSLVAMSLLLLSVGPLMGSNVFGN